MRLPGHLTWLLRNLYAGQEEIEPDVEPQPGSKSGREYITQNARLDEAQAGIKVSG